MKSLLTLAALAVAFVPELASAGLTSGYRLDEISGNLAPDLVRGASGNGTLANFGGAQWVPGKIGSALEFDGSNDFVLALNCVPTGTTAFSISMWAWADSTRDWGTLIKNWGESSIGSFHLGFDGSSGKLSNYLGAPQAGPVLASTALTLNTWHHIALTWSGTTHNETLYIDGSVAGTFVTPASMTSLTAIGANMAFGVKPNQTTTGAAADCCPGYWDGKMDDIAFFDTALTAGEVSQIKINGDNGISAVVPEPGSVILAIAGAAGMAVRRRRR